MRILAVAVAAGWALCALAGLAATFWLAHMPNRMRDVPAGLNYSTTRLSDAGLFRATYIAEGGSVLVNQLQIWTLHAETAEGQSVTNAGTVVDGDMP